MRRKLSQAQPGAKLLFTGAPRFHEFVLQTERSPAQWSQRLLDEQDCRRHRLEPLVSRAEERTLWCATEMVTREQIDAAAKGAGSRA
jgi:glycine dehydrogenase subunit 1